MVKVSSVFHNLTYWNLEIPPSSDDGVVRAMEWPTLADAVSFRPLHPDIAYSYSQS